MMGKFIELRFGQGDLGRSLDIRKNVDDSTFFVQRELVPVEAIRDAYVILPEGRNIKIKFEADGHIYSRVEYYKNRIDCIKRWVMIKKYCGMTAKLDCMNPVPLPMDANDLEKATKEDKHEEED